MLLGDGTLPAHLECNLVRKVGMHLLVDNVMYPSNRFLRGVF